MMWIKNNLFISIAFIISIFIHSIIFMYNRVENKDIENIIYLEMVEQHANTDTIINNESEKVQEEKFTEKQKVEKTAKNVIKNKKIDKPKKVAKKDKIKSQGKNEINNQAQSYIKNNIANIQKEIMNNIIYPPRAKKLGIEGMGYIVIIINKTGEIKSAKAIDFPNKILSDAALKAVKKVGYVTSHNLVSDIELKIPVEFYLQ